MIFSKFVAETKYFFKTKIWTDYNIIILFFFLFKLYAMCMHTIFIYYARRHASATVVYIIKIIAVDSNS